MGKKKGKKAKAVEQVYEAQEPMPDLLALIDEEEAQMEKVEEVPVEKKAAPRVSRAARRREEKRRKEEEEEEALRIASLHAVNHGQIEWDAIEKKANAIGHTIVEVAADGNCMYQSLSMQRPQYTQADLRGQVAAFLLANASTYGPFLELDGGTVEAYCERLANTAEWGGEVELQILSQLLSVHITVLQAYGDAIEIGEGKDLPRVYLSFHKRLLASGNHYNAVVAQD